MPKSITKKALYLGRSALPFAIQGLLAKGPEFLYIYKSVFANI